jgi:hydroxymethylglutaryl-CoA lyase
MDPTVHPAGSLPARADVYEVGPRDGLQNEASPLDVAIKVEFVERLVAAGIRSLELTAMVRPDRVPQLADAEELLRRLDLPGDVRAVVLVANDHGMRRAMSLGVREIAIFASATETFSKRNLGCSIDDSFHMFEPVVAEAHREGIAVRAYVSMCFGDPWEGRVPIPQVVAVGRRLLDLGCHELSVGDTIGTGTSGHVVALVDAFESEGVSVDKVAAHFHDTYGQALANASAALQRGITTIDTSAGGLGGCPYAGSATGNLATEDLLWHLHGSGVTTGVDLGALAETSRWLAEHLGRPSPSRAVQALHARRLERA